MPVRAYYQSPVKQFLNDRDDRILGVLTREHHHSLEEQQRSAWLQQLSLLRPSLCAFTTGTIFLEFQIPRMGKRADAVLISDHIVSVIEFKIGASRHDLAALYQVEDYALDLKNFHQSSHAVPIVPILVSTHAPSQPLSPLLFANDLVASPVRANGSDLGRVLQHVHSARDFPTFCTQAWMAGGYRPTPTIIEAAQVLYLTHRVEDISRSDASAKNLGETSATVMQIIDRARKTGTKAICFVTGVPGSGKTLAGLNIATQRSDDHGDEHAVFLSGNGPPS